MKSIGPSHIGIGDALNKSDIRSSPDGDRSIVDPYIVRYRETSVSSDLGASLIIGNITSAAATPNEDDIAKFCQESNYSYSFATLPGMKRLTYVRRRSCERNLDCVRLIRSKLDGLDAGRRYSQPDIGVMDEQHSQYEFMARQQSYTSKLKQKARYQYLHALSTGHNYFGGFFGKSGYEENNWHSSNNNNNNTDFTDIDFGNHHFSKSTYSSLPTSPVFWDYEPDHEASIPEEDNETEAAVPDGNGNDRQQRSASVIHPPSHQTATMTTVATCPTFTTHHDCHLDEALPPMSTSKPSDTVLNAFSNSNISSSTIKVSPGTTNNVTALARNHNASCASRYLRALHTPTRFLPQQQAILTTDADGNLLLFNDISCLCLGIDKSYIGRPIFNKFDGPGQRMISHRLRKRKKQLRRKSILLQHQQLSADQSDMVLMCGVIIPIIKTKEQKSAASLWLKEKWNHDQGRFVYLWIFEEIFESRLTLTFDSKGMIQDTTLATIQDIYGYHKREVIGRPINKILPSLNVESNTARELVNVNRFYGSRSKNGKHFPSMVQLQDNELQITSLPSISGLITIHQSGMVQSMNPVPAKYLFGYKAKGVVETMHIDQLLPQFMTLVMRLNQQHLLRHDRMITFEECMDILRQSSETNSLSQTPTAETKSIIAVHRDGSQFDVELEIRWVESDDEKFYSVWITYNRINSVTTLVATNTGNDIPDNIPKTVLSTNQSSLLKQQHSALITDPNIFTTNTINSAIPKEPELVSKCESVQQKFKNKQQQQHNQPSRSTFSRFERFGSVPKEKALFPGIHSNSSSAAAVAAAQSVMDPSSILLPEFDDYVVIDSLGEGTYGTVKLVYLKSDPSQKFVIKAIMKSRIIVDSWIRDRKHGSIPIEIHILLKLQQHLHVNCPQLVTFFEDDDNYYVVTRLHGDGMDLFDYIELNDEMTEAQVRRIFRQVAAAVQHLHHLRIVHRDIKDENILLNEHGIVQLIDFGSAAYYREGRLFDSFSGTLDHSSPEVLSGTPYAGPPQDMWSLGILLYTLIYRETPFYSVDDIMERNLQLPYIPYPEKACGPVDLLCKLLDRDINKRPTIDQVMQDPWLQNCA